MGCMKLNTALMLARAVQTALGFGIMAFGIALNLPWISDYTLFIPATFCGAGIGAFGFLGLLATNRRIRAHWLLVLIIDLLAFGNCIGSATVLLRAMVTPQWYWGYPGDVMLQPPIAFTFICMILIVPLMWHSTHVARRSKADVNELKFKEGIQYDTWHSPTAELPVQPRSVRQSHLEDQQTDRTSTYWTRPLSTAESAAHGSDTSGTVTLAPASISSDDTKPPPAYASPGVSRAPTNAHR